jgi:hypothetical protein
MRVAMTLGLLGTVAVLAQTQSTQEYRDSALRFTFSYSSAFGATSPGTNNGFGDRVAAVAFSTFPARFKGEAVLTRGFPLVDLQAVGGLYDSIALEIFPDALRAQLIAQLPRLTAANICDALARETHIDPSLAAFASWTAAQRQAISKVDTMRNARPHVVSCRVSDDIALFDKTRSFAVGDPTQHVFGAVRFLRAPYSTFQIVAGGDAPEPSTLAAMETLVRSLAVK